MESSLVPSIPQQFSLAKILASIFLDNGLASAARIVRESLLSAARHSTRTRPVVNIQEMISDARHL